MAVDPKKHVTPYLKIYLYLLALGLMLFGIFAMYFRTYDHPFYGRLDLGEHNVVIGVVSFLLGCALTYYISHKFDR